MPDVQDITVALAQLADQVRMLGDCTGCHTPADAAAHAAQAVEDFAARLAAGQVTAAA